MKLLNSVANQIPTPPRRPSRLTPYLFFLLFALIAGVTYLGGLPPADPSVSSAPSALNPTAASTATPQYVTKEIRDVRIFDWVLATNPELTDADRAEFPDIEPDNWRLVSLAMPKQDGSRLDISLARPVSWLQANRVAPGTTIDLDLPEMGAQGPAQVRSVRPCPPVSAAGSPMSAIGSDQRERTTSSERQLQLVGGPAAPDPKPDPRCRLVTGLFRHTTADILDVSGFSGEVFWGHIDIMAVQEISACTHVSADGAPAPQAPPDDSRTHRHPTPTGPGTTAQTEVPSTTNRLL